MPKIVDLTNFRFGKLVALEVVGRSNGGTKIWKCQCDCGNMKEVLMNNLTNGSTNSCGCLKSELVSEKNKKYNCYDLSGSYGIGYTTRGDEFYFDLEDYVIIKDYCWSLDNHGYLRSSKNKKKINMARLIMNTPENMVVDHIDRNIVDNRKENLRNCSSMNNSWNTKRVGGKHSGFSGVYWNEKNKNYWSFITCNHKLHYLGSFKNIEDAKEARTQAEFKYFGEFRRSDDYR